MFHFSGNQDENRNTNADSSDSISINGAGNIGTIVLNVNRYAVFIYFILVIIKRYTYE